MDDYDVIVIGTGTAAQVVSSRVRRAGRSVAMIDHLPFGGICALRGCDPKKMLVSGAEAADWARRMHRRGVVGELRINWKELIAFKRTFTDPYRRSARRVSPNRASMPSTGWPAFLAPTRSWWKAARSKAVTS
jgi:glutathione reductase (NADPH)